MVEGGESVAEEIERSVSALENVFAGDDHEIITDREEEDREEV